MEVNMSMLLNEVKQEVKKKFDKELRNPVKLIYFTEKLECQSCKETHQLLDEIVTLSDKISLNVFNFAIDKEEVDKYKIDKIPAIVIMNEKDYGIRLFGLPAGYEFSSLIEGITLVSTGKTGLNEKSIERIATLTNPVHIQVFASNT
jgi:glutaredoxin-like protein